MMADANEINWICHHRSVSLEQDMFESALWMRRLAVHKYRCCIGQKASNLERLNYSGGFLVVPVDDSVDTVTPNDMRPLMRRKEASGGLTHDPRSLIDSPDLDCHRY